MNPYEQEMYYRSMMQNQYPYQFNPYMSFDPQMPMGFNPNQLPPSMQRMSPLTRLTKNMNLQSMLQTTTKTVSTMNQVVPIVYQVAPIISNARNAFRVFRVVRALSDIDLAEIDSAIVVDDIEESENETTPVIQEQKEEELFENML